MTVLGARSGPAASRPPSYPSRAPRVRQWAPLPMRVRQVYPFAMIELPASYKEYLAGKSQMVIDTVRPVLM
ncbi:MAG TPA: hypothetical protein VJQ80_10610, partial [Arthrobacter sp.]|nr:hypothetical protein [Arthrobacter sp.]